MSKKSTKPQVALPPDVKASDLAYPKWNGEDNSEHLGYDKLKELGLDTSDLTFYEVKGEMGWVLTTLLIGGGKGNSPARYYGITVKGEKVVRVGRGPHVVSEVKVYLKKDNIDRLRKYVDLYNKGLGDAGLVRDRISSRRAQGQINRAAGMSSWMW